MMHRRRLPHLHVLGEPLFVTFRLKDSLPAWRAFPAASVTSGQAFLVMDRMLDEGRGGPRFLGRPEVAEVVLDSVRLGVGLGHYELHSWVIMPNHVHVLITPRQDVSRLMCSLKSASARRANLVLGRSGEAFWQDESYDHLVRDQAEFHRIQRYIEQNAVRAGLVQRAEDFAWSSAWRPERPPQAGGLPHS